MKIAAIIPARYNSERFPGKPLARVMGVPMIELVYNQVLKVKKFSEIIVGTDDKRIFDVVKNFGGNPVMTSGKCRSGTDRVWEVVEKLDVDAAVNIQGDEPLISKVLLSDIYDKLCNENQGVVTAAFFNTSFEDFISENVVKAVFTNNGKALYFSRSPIPYCKKEDFKGFYNHVGIYGYRKDKLMKFVKLQESRMEMSEKLEQLRFLENSIGVDVIKTDFRSMGVDSPADIIKVEKILKGRSN